MSSRPLAPLVLLAALLLVPTILVDSAASAAADGSTVSGNAVPGVEVTVRNSTGGVLCRVNTDDTGRWTCALPTSIPCDVEMTATQLVLGLVLPAVKVGLLECPDSAAAPVAAPQNVHVAPAAPRPGGPGELTPVVPPAAPTAPRSTPPAAGVLPIAGDGTALVTWTSAGEPAGTVFTVTSVPASDGCQSTATQCLVTGLDNGVPYTFQVVAAAPGLSPAPPVLSASITPEKASQNLDLRLEQAPGGPVADAPSHIAAHGLMPGTDVVVTVYSSPRVLATFTSAADGSLSESVELPGDLAVGSHRLVAQGQGIDGSIVESETSFTITRAHEFSPPAYNQAEHPQDAVKTVLAATVLALVAGGFGARRRPAPPTPWTPPRRSGDKPELSMAQQEFRATSIERGDRSITWLSPFQRSSDALSRSLPNRLVNLSPLVARFVNDAAYLRAIFGTFALVGPLAGLVLGVKAALQVHGEALPPATWLIVTIVVLSMLDAMIGVAAAVAYTAVVVFAGGVGDLAALRCLIAIDIVFFSVILVVSSTRELRREPARTRAEWFDRLADFAVAFPLSVWTAGAAFGSLPGLTGLDLPIGHVGTRVLLLIGAVVLLRFALETITAHWYPRRLLVVAPEEVTSASTSRERLTLVIELAAFAFFAASYMGVTPLLWAGVALVLFSATMDRWAKWLPDWPFLAKFIPGGIIGMVFYFLLGQAASTWFQSVVHDPRHVVQWGFVVLMLPGIACALIAKTARNGEGWTLNWAARWWGIPTLAVTILIVGGYVTLW